MDFFSVIFNAVDCNTSSVTSSWMVSVIFNLINAVDRDTSSFTSLWMVSVIFNMINVIDSNTASVTFTSSLSSIMSKENYQIYIIIRNSEILAATIASDMRCLL